MPNLYICIRQINKNFFLNIYEHISFESIQYRYMLNVSKKNRDFNLHKKLKDVYKKYLNKLSRWKMFQLRIFIVIIYSILLYP